jgi:AraC family transcriptional regulator, positive regulator of tynA and feaB
VDRTVVTVQTWDLSTCPPWQRLARWRDVLCEAFVPLTPTATGDGSDAAGRIAVRTLSGLTCSALSSHPQRVAHGPREVARSDDSWFFVNLQVSGRCHVRQGATETTVRPGGIVVVDTTRPYWFDHDVPWEILSFRVPHASLAGRLTGPEAGLGRVVDGEQGVGGVLASMMRALWRVDEDLPAPATAELQDSLTAMTALALAGVPDVMEPDRRLVQRTAIVRHVALRLSDHRLGVASVCREFGISPRHLQNLFADSGAGFAETVRRMRLDHCAARLADPTARTSVTQLGLDHGFLDSSSFSRAFRRQFGVSPSEHRDQATAAGRRAAGWAQPAG